MFFEQLASIIMNLESVCVRDVEHIYIHRDRTTADVLDILPSLDYHRNRSITMF